MAKKPIEDIDTLVNEGISDCFTASQVFKAIPYDIIDKALMSIDRRHRRLGSFPDHLVVYYVILMALFMELAYDHVFTKLSTALSWLSNDCFKLKQISHEAIVQARQRLTFQPLMSLFELVTSPLASPLTPGAFFRGLRLVVIDGSVFDVQDTPANVVGFGRPGSKCGDGAYPQVRCVALIEQATRAVFDLVFGPIATTDEHTLAREILARLKPGMLCLADRLYPCFQYCQTVINTGGHFAWRVQKNITLKPIKLLEDKSYLAKLYANRKKGKSSHRIKSIFIIVRVLEYTLNGSPEVYRLITSILDPEQASAEELVRLYPKRWTQETFYGEIKTTLRKSRIVLRSKKPDQVIQELYGLFIAHFLVRAFMFEAASVANVPPDTLSFKHSVFVLKDSLPDSGNFSP